MTKPFGLQEFLARVRNLLRGRALEEHDGARYDDGYLTIDLAQRRIAVGGQEIRLTRKEFAVLIMLFAHRDRLVTQTHLLREIWGPVHAQDTILFADYRRSAAPEAG